MFPATSSYWSTVEKTLNRRQRKTIKNLELINEQARSYNVTTKTTVMLRVKARIHSRHSALELTWWGPNCRCLYCVCCLLHYCVVYFIVQQ